MRSASVLSLNRARGFVAWSISTSLGWSSIPQSGISSGSLQEYDFLSDVTPSWPAFVAVPEAFIPEELFPYYFLFCGVGIVPGFCHNFLAVYVFGITSVFVLVPRVLVVPLRLLNLSIIVGVLILYFFPSQCVIVQNNSSPSLSEDCWGLLVLL